MTSDRFIEGKLSKFVAYCAFRVLSAYIFEDYMQKAGFHVANLIIVIADEVSAMIDHAMKEIHAAALLYYYREISNLLFVSINGTI